MRLMHSGRDFAWLYLRQDQVSFLDGHVRAFEHFGCVPQRIAYDNLKAAVAKLLVGSERLLTGRFEALSSHYLFEPCFCRPRTGHDKGGVEARGKTIRWQHLVPIPREKSLETMRAVLLARLDASYDGERFAVERVQSIPLASTRFDARKLLSAVTVTRRSLVAVDGAAYSVPCTWAGLSVSAYVGVDDVTLVGPSGAVTHSRVRFGHRAIDYRHYLRELATKPQAVRQIAAPLMRDLGEPFGAAWRSLVDAHGPKQAARIFAKVLSFIETRGIDVVARVIDDALARNEPLLLALAPPPTTAPTVHASQLPDALRTLDVVAGCAADYDALFAGGKS
jgi:hypothetical protein